MITYMLEWRETELGWEADDPAYRYEDGEAPRYQIRRLTAGFIAYFGDTAISDILATQWDAAQAASTFVRRELIKIAGPNGDPVEARLARELIAAADEASVAAVRKAKPLNV